MDKYIFEKLSSVQEQLSREIKEHNKDLKYFFEQQKDITVNYRYDKGDRIDIVLRHDKQEAMITVSFTWITSFISKNLHAFLTELVTDYHKDREKVAAKLKHLTAMVQKEA